VAGRFDGEILAPFFEEGGRFTIGDTHYVQQGEELTPAGDTEFARDAVFGYRSSFLPAWVQEKSRGRVAAGVVGSVSIEDIRQGGPDRVAEILTGVSGGKIVVANSANIRRHGSVRTRAAARRGGRQAVHLPRLSLVRAGARRDGRAFRSSRSPILYPKGAPKAAGITFVGSHVQRSTEQLEQAVNLADLQVRELKVPRLLEPSTRDAEVHDTVAWLEDQYSPWHVHIARHRLADV